MNELENNEPYFHAWFITILKVASLEEFQTLVLAMSVSLKTGHSFLMVLLKVPIHLNVKLSSLLSEEPHYFMILYSI